MWPLLLCSLISLTIIIERVLFWWQQAGRRDVALVETLLEHTSRGDFETAIAAGEQSSDLEASVIVAGLTHRDHGHRETMEVTAQDGIERMKRGLNALDTIVTLAPLLGIRGTVLGIIQSFDLLGSGGIEDPQAVTGGIARALITTAAGLSIAMVTLIPFNCFIGRVQKATRHLEKLASRFEVMYKKGLGTGHAARERV